VKGQEEEENGGYLVNGWHLTGTGTPRVMEGEWLVGDWLSKNRTRENRSRRKKEGGNILRQNAQHRGICPDVE